MEIKNEGKDKNNKGSASDNNNFNIIDTMFSYGPYNDSSSSIYRQLL